MMDSMGDLFPDFSTRVTILIFLLFLLIFLSLLLLLKIRDIDSEEKS